MNTIMDIEQLKYPRGQMEVRSNPSAAEVEAWLRELESFPAQWRAALQDLSDEQLDTPYRPGGWTVRQLAHHVPDSHVQAYIRTNWTLTEERPTIKPYDQDAWSKLEYYRTAPIASSLDFVDLVHKRWLAILRALSPAQWKREYVHPEHNRSFALDELIQVYAWHSRHHLAHVTSLRQRNGW